MRPRLKGVVWERDGQQLQLVYDIRDHFLLADPDGAVDGLLDGHGLLEDGDRLGRLGADEQERYFSNLAFFESFASLARGREDFQETLRAAHVLVLGTGGLNSNTIPHLC